MRNKIKYILIIFLVLATFAVTFFYIFLPSILKQRADKNLFENIELLESAMLQNSFFTIQSKNNYFIKRDEKYNLYYTKIKGNDNKIYDILYIYEKSTAKINPLCLEKSQNSCRFIGYFDIEKNELGGVIKPNLNNNNSDINFKINPNFPDESEVLMQEKLTLF